jgi:hypothetical protein
MASGRVRSCAEITRRGGLQKGYLARLMRLAFVAPRIVDAVAAVARRPVLPCKWSVSADRRLEAGNSQRISLRSLLLRAGNAIETDCEALLPRHRVFWRALGLSLEAAEPKWGCPSYWNAAAELVAVSLMAHQENTFFERRGVVRTAIGVSGDQGNSSARRKLQNDVVG